jgi:hypothetical protein
MPLKSQLHVNQLLSNVSVQYKNQEYLWDKIFPQVTVAKDSDLYRVYDRNYRIPETARAPKARAKEMGFEFSSSSFILEQHALKDYVGIDEDINNDMGSLQVDATEYLTDAIYRRMEFMMSELFTKTSWSLSVSLSATTVWSANTTVSDPIPVWDTGTTTIIANSGQAPNFAFTNRANYVQMKNHISVLDRVKYTSSDVGMGAISALIGVENFYVSNAIYNTGAEGAVSGTAAGGTTFFASKSFLGYKPASPGLRQASSGYTFLNNAPRVRTWKDEEINAMAVEVEIKFSPKIVASLTGYLIGN